MAKTAWGDAKGVEEVVVNQGEYEAIVQLLEDDEGEALVRFAYGTGGTARRGPLTLRDADLRKLRKALAKKPALRAALARATS